MNQQVDELDSQLLLGRYRIVQRLGEGGMGTVHLARIEGPEGFTRPVVVKRMRTDIKSTDEGNKLFKREAQILSKMQHPGIVNILDFGVEDGAHIMVLEYMHGYTLTPLLDYHYSTKQPLPVDICLYIVRKVLDALQYAHHFDSDAGHVVEIVHRDVAPDNILLSKKGYVHLLDFGVASIRGPAGPSSTQTGAFRGKLGYAAPETVHGHEATPRSDQYSAAAVLWELLTQQTPFSSDSIGMTVQRMVQEQLPPPSQLRPDIPRGLDAVLARALEKEPSKRFDSAISFARELRGLQAADDDDVAQQLRDLVRRDFDLLPEKIGIEPLRAREEALARELPTGGPPGPVTLASSSTVRDSSQHRRSGRDSATTIGVGTSIQPQDSQREVRRLLLGLLVIGAVIALALGAAVALLSKSGSGEQVVVVEGERSNANSAPIDDPNASEPADEATGSTAAPAAPESQPPPKQTDESPQQRLATAVRGQSAAFRNCFQSHLEAAQAVGSVELHFSVPATGGQAQVAVTPSALAGTPLGGCLVTAGEQVTFPALPQATSFSLPLRARVSQ